ncbi:MAG: FMN-binding negative transcriptional regulator [Flavobacteriales bacterium AspAUS03]
MYIPKHFKQWNGDVILEVVCELRFGTLVSVEDGISVATHLPLDLVEIR